MGPSVSLQPNVLVAVDVAIFTVRPAERVEDAWQVLLIQQEAPEHGGRWSLPGVIIRPDEPFEEAARRALCAKAGLDAPSLFLDPIATFGRPDRDERGRVVSVLHLALVNSADLEPVAGRGVLRAAWRPVRAVINEPLVYDHAEMLQVAAQRAQAKLRYSNVAVQLVRDPFTIHDLRWVYAAILDPALLRLHSANFKATLRSLFDTDALKRVGIDSEAPLGRKPALYHFCGSLKDQRERELVWGPRLDLAS